VESEEWRSFDRLRMTPGARDDKEERKKGGTAIDREISKMIVSERTGGKEKWISAN